MPAGRPGSIAASSSGPIRSTVDPKRAAAGHVGLGRAKGGRGFVKIKAAAPLQDRRAADLRGQVLPPLGPASCRRAAMAPGIAPCRRRQRLAQRSAAATAPALGKAPRAGSPAASCGLNSSDGRTRSTVGRADRHHRVIGDGARHCHSWRPMPGSPGSTSTTSWPSAASRSRDGQADDACADHGDFGGACSVMRHPDWPARCRTEPFRSTCRPQTARGCFRASSPPGCRRRTGPPAPCRSACRDRAASTPIAVRFSGMFSVGAQVHDRGAEAVEAALDAQIGRRRARSGLRWRRG